MTALKPFMHKAVLSLLASCTVCITALFFSAGLVYYTNINEYSIPFSAFLRGMAALSWPLVLVIAIVLCALPKKYSIFQHGIAVMVLAALGAYLYSTFILWHYGVRDGKTIDWNAYWHRGIVDLVVAAVFIFLVYKYWRKLYAYAGRIFLCLLVIQCITLLSYHWTSGVSKRLAAQKKYIDLNYSMNFSEKENIIFIVIDSLPYDVFEGLTKEKKYRDYFQSFLSFTDCAAGFPTTIASIGLMLTGKYYDNSIPLSEFYFSAFASPDSLTEFCKQNEYFIDLNTEIVSIFNAPFSKYADNVTDTFSVRAGSLSELVTAALFRSSPHLFKRYFSAGNKILANIDAMLHVWDFRFLDAVQNKPVSKSYEKPLFSFIHLMGYHAPYQIDANFKYHKNGVESIEQAKACLNLMNLFMDKLRNSGLYDNSTIIITADHSNRFSAHIPLLIKPRHAQNAEMQNIDIPVSLADVPSIAVRFANDPDFNLDNFKPLENRFYNFYTFEDTWAADFLPTITRYEIEGQASDNDSYIKTAVFRPGFEPISLAGPIKVDFLNNRNDFDQVIVGNFGFDPVAGLVAKGRNDFAFIFKDLSTSHIKMIADFVGEKDKEAIVEIRYNLIRSGKHFNKSFSLSEPIVFPAVDELWMRFANIQSIASLSLEPFDDASKSKVTIGNEYFLNEEDAYHILIANSPGFSRNENWGVWTDGNDASLVIPWETVPVNPVAMVLKIHHIFLAPNIPTQRAFAYVGDTMIAAKEFMENTDRQWVIELDPRHFNGEKEWMVRFDLPDSASPKSLGMSGDSRSLALGFKSLQFLDAPGAALLKEPPVKENEPLAEESKSLVEESKPFAGESKPTIALGVEYLLSKENAFDLLIPARSGFSSQESWGVWTDGGSASLAASWKTAPVKPVCMILKLNQIFVNPKIPLQRASVYAGDTMIASKEFTKNGGQEWLIELDPRHFGNDKEWTIRFDLPDSASPKSLGISDDSRSLALGFESVQFLEATDKVLSKESPVEDSKPSAEESKPKPTIALGVEYLLSDEDAFERLTAGSSGFASRENWGVWTNGGSASLVIPWETVPASPVVMILKTYQGFVNSKVPLQRASIYAGDTLIASKEFIKNGRQQWLIELDPRHFDNGKEWTIRFDLPDSASPKSLGISDDSRSLALGFESVQFLDAANAALAKETPVEENKSPVEESAPLAEESKPKPAIALGVEYLLSNEDAFERLIAGSSGFASRENWGVWTNGGSASLVIPWETAPASPVVMILKTYQAFVNPKIPLQRASVYAGDTLIASKEFTKNGGQQWLIELDPRYFGNNKEWTIRFDLPDSASPKSLGISDDSRSLALGFESVQFLDATDEALAKETPVEDSKPPVEESKPKPTIALGVEYPLSNEDAFERLTAGSSGFASRENWGVWTNGGSASLVIPWETVPANPVVMILQTYQAFVNPKVPLQRASVYAGDTLVASKEFTKNGRQQWLIELDPRHFGNDKEWTIRFDLPDSVSPKSLGINDDSRSLALGFESVQFLDATDEALAKETPVEDSKPPVEESKPKPTIALGVEYLLSNEDAFERLIAGSSGFASRESWGVWTNGGNASLVIPWETAPTSPVVMILKTYQAFVNSKVPLQRASIYAGDTLIASKEFAKNGGEQWSIELDPRHFDNDKEWTIRFDLPDSVSPNSLGISDDQRSLALGFESLQFLNAPDDALSSQQDKK